jgi:hypothetical protein
MKMTVVVERIHHRQQQRQAAQTVINMALIIEKKSLVEWAFRRVKSLTTLAMLKSGAMFNTISKAFSNLNRICVKKELKHKLGYMGLWQTHIKLIAYDSTSQINNLIKTIYLTMVNVIEDECELHSIVNLSLRRITGCELAQFKLHRAVESLMVFYQDSEVCEEQQTTPPTGAER